MHSHARGHTTAVSFAEIAVAAVVSGLAMALFSRSEWPWIALGFVGLVPWIRTLSRVHSLRAALLAGTFMSVTYHLSVAYWTPSAIHDFTGTPWVLALVFSILIAPLVQLQFVSYALARFLLQRSFRRTTRGVAAVGAACAYVATEWYVPQVFADSLGYWLYGSAWLRQGADVAGVLGLTLVLLLANECCHAVLRGLWADRSRAKRAVAIAPALGLALLVLLPLGYGAMRYHEYSHVDESAVPVRFGVVQAGFSHVNYIAEEFGTYLMVRTVLDTHVAMSRDLLVPRDADVVLWPESAYPLSFGTPTSEQHAEFDRRIRELVARTMVPLVFGARDLEENQWFNAAFFLEPQSKDEVAVAVYRKARLFPFVEHAPGALDSPLVRRFFPWLGTFTPGPGPAVVDLRLADGRAFRVVPMICYDALHTSHALSAMRAGGEVLLTLSNDSWFEFGNAPRHLLYISAFRSVETRRPQVRAAVTGISAAISPAGDILDQLDTGEYGTLTASLLPARGSSPLARLGNWLGPAAFGVLLLIMAAGSLARRRHAREPEFEP